MKNIKDVANQKRAQILQLQAQLEKAQHDLAALTLVEHMLEDDEPTRVQKGVEEAYQGAANLGEEARAAREQMVKSGNWRVPKSDRWP